MAEKIKAPERPRPARTPEKPAPTRPMQEQAGGQRPSLNGPPPAAVGPMGGNGRALQQLQSAAGNQAMSRLMEPGAGERPAGPTAQAPTESREREVSAALTPTEQTPTTTETEQREPVSPAEAPPAEASSTERPSPDPAKPSETPPTGAAKGADTAAAEGEAVEREADLGAKVGDKAPVPAEEGPPAEGEGAAGTGEADARETEESAKKEGKVAPEEGGDKAKEKGKEKASDTEEGEAETEAEPAEAAPLAETPPPTEHVFEWTPEMTENLTMPPQEELGDVEYDPFQARAEAAAKVATLQALAQVRSAQMMAETAVAIATVQAQGLTSIAHVQQFAATQVALVQAQYAAAREAVLADAEARKQLVTALMLLGYGQAIVQSVKTGVAIQLHAVTYKDKARQAVKTRQDAAKKHGQDEGERGKEAIDAQAEEARQRGRTKAAGYPDTERGRAQATAVLEVTKEVAAELEKPGPDLKTETIKVGNELVNGMDGAEAEVVSGINRMALTTTVQIGAQTIGLKQQFDNMEKGLHAQIDVFALTMAANLSMAEATAVAQLQLLAVQAIPHLLTTVLQYQAIALGEQDGATDYINEAVATIAAAILAEERPNPEVVAELIGYGENAVEGMAGQYLGQLRAGQTAVLAGILEAEIIFMLGALEISGAAQAAATGMVGQAAAGFNALVGVAQAGTQALNLAWLMALTSLEIATVTEFNNAVTGMEAELDKGLKEGKQEITKTVDKAVKKNGEPLNELDAKLEEAAHKAREEYDAAWYEKLFSWSYWGDVLWAIGKALLTFVLVIATFVLGVILFVVGAILFLMGNVVLGIILMVVGAILALGAIIYVVWGILEGIYHRWQSASGFWQSTWAIVVGILDLTGIPNIIEGVSGYDIVNGRKLTDEEAAARLGNGIFNFVVLLIPFLLRGGKPKGGGSGKKPPTKPKPKEPVKPPKKKPVEPPKKKPVEPPKEKPVKPPKKPKEKPPEKPKEKPPKKDLPEEKVKEKKLDEAEKTETGDRQQIKTKEDLAKAKENAPSKDNPPSDLKAREKGLWDDYVDYWHERIAEIEKEIDLPPEARKTKPPLEWEAYREFRGRFARGRVFQEEVTKEVKSERPDLDVQQDVGVKKGAESTKFVDQLGVDKSNLVEWESAGKPADKVPEVESFSNKSRKFEEISDIDGQVKTDIAEALTKYDGQIEIRRPSHPLFGFTAKVKKVTLIYDKSLTTPEIRAQILKSAEGTGVEVLFK